MKKLIVLTVVSLLSLTSIAQETRDWTQTLAYNDPSYFMVFQTNNFSTIFLDTLSTFDGLRGKMYYAPNKMFTPEENELYTKLFYMAAHPPLEDRILIDRASLYNFTSNEINLKDVSYFTYDTSIFEEVHVYSRVFNMTLILMGYYYYGATDRDLIGLIDVYEIQLDKTHSLENFLKKYGNDFDEFMVTAVWSEFDTFILDDNTKKCEGKEYFTGKKERVDAMVLNIALIKLTPKGKKILASMR
jgi:hypothetical protein